MNQSTANTVPLLELFVVDPRYVDVVVCVDSWHSLKFHDVVYQVLLSLINIYVNRNVLSTESNAISAISLLVNSVKRYSQTMI